MRVARSISELSKNSLLMVSNRKIHSAGEIISLHLEKSASKYVFELSTDRAIHLGKNEESLQRFRRIFTTLVLLLNIVICIESEISRLPFRSFYRSHRRPCIEWTNRART